MLSKEEYIVLHHYLGEGVSKTAIAKKLGISRMTVHRYAADKKTEPGYDTRARKPSLLDPYKDYIRGRLKIYPELSAVRLFKEIEERGYPGKLTQLRNFIRLIRPKPPIEFERRFEVSAGEQAQVDFATFKTDFGVVYALLVVLSWSRYLWVRFSCHQDQLTVLSGLHRAFVEFAGVPDTELFDRMKAAVARSEGNGAAVFNEEMLRFAAHYGFRPVACRPYRAKTKGRVERAVSYLRQNFFYGRHFRDLEDLNDQLETWLEETANVRIHGTTGEIPSQRLFHEKIDLKPLPTTAYIPLVTLGRRVSRDGFVAYNGNEYSVPDGLKKMAVEVKATLEEVNLYQEGRLLVSHPVLEGRGQRLMDPAHRRHNKHRNREKIFQMSDDTVEVQRRSLDVYEEVLR
jgi:transposase